MGALWTVDSEANVLRCVEFWHVPSTEVTGFEAISREITFPLGIGLPGRVWASGSPVWVPAVTEDANFPRALYAAAAGLRAAFGVPIRSGDQVVAVLEFFSSEIQQPDQPLLDMMAALGSQIGQFMERKRAEEAVRINEARKVAILEAAPDGIVSIDQAGNIVEFNPAAERLFGFRAAEVLGREMADLIIPLRLRDQHRRGLAHYLATGEGPMLDKRLELAALRADGTEFSAELTITRLPNDGHPAFTAFVRDITERERTGTAMRLLVDAGIALGQSLDYEKTLGELASLTVPELADWCAFDLVGEGSTIERVVVNHVDPAKIELARELQRRHPPDPDAPRGVPNVVRTGNPEFYPVISDELLASTVRHPGQLELARSLGLRSAIIVPLNARGRTLGALTLVMAESGRRFEEADLALAEQLASRAALAVDNAQLYQQVQDQLLIHVQLNAALRQSGAARDRALEELQQVTRSRHEFLTAAAHDLQNPLAALKGMAQLLQRTGVAADGPEAAKLTEGLKAIESSVSNMSDMVGQLLDLALIESNQQLPLARRPTDLVALVHRATDEAQPAADGHRIQVETTAEEILGDWDAVRLQRVVSNLLSNAMKFSPDGGNITLIVATEEEQEGVWATVAVRDEGLGIPPADQPRLFERFHRGANVVGRIGGTGIGLTSVRQIVVSHGGTVTVESEEGVGSTFTIRLPLR